MRDYAAAHYFLQWCYNDIIFMIYRFEGILFLKYSLDRYKSFFILIFLIAYSF